jgi:hypothetical protein
MRDTNRELLLSAARLLRPLLKELVFVGGCATGLLITDEAAAGVRATIDVDAIAKITSYREYVEFAVRLGKAGFTEDSIEGALLCRWNNGGIILDAMPLDSKILGFSNRWYKEAMAAATSSARWSRHCVSEASPRLSFWRQSSKRSKAAVDATTSPATTWKTCSR